MVEKPDVNEIIRAVAVMEEDNVVDVILVIIEIEALVVIPALVNGVDEVLLVEAEVIVV